MKSIVRKISTFILILLCFNVLPVISENLEPRSYHEEIKELMREFNVKSSSVILVNNGKTIFLGGFGKEHILTDDSINGDSIFEAASLGKMVAAYITLKLANEGKLNLDDSIVKYLSNEWITDDVRFQNITIKNLLSHTAGFSPHFEILMDKDIYFEPGSRFSYSGVGYMYLQKIIENVTGKDFEEVAREYVFTPLKMDKSTFTNIKTVTPFMNSMNLTIYVFLIFIIMLIIFLIVMFILYFITRGKLFSKRVVLGVSITLAFIINAAFLILFIPKATIAFVAFLVIGIIILLLTKSQSKNYPFGFLAYTIIVIILGVFLHISIPLEDITMGIAQNVKIGNLIPNEPNCAYSLHSNLKDMSLFCDELLKQYHSGNNMFNPKINIDENNSWGLGIAIEKIGDETTYWHSGINPGFQSLVVLNPAKNSYIVILTNSDNGLNFSRQVARELLNLEGRWDIKLTELNSLYYILKHKFGYLK